MAAAAVLRLLAAQIFSTASRMPITPQAPACRLGNHSAGLALPLEVAIAFLHVAGRSWSFAYHLLRNHPDSVKAAA